MAPLASLALGVAGVLQFAGEVCWLGAPPWDYTLGVLLLFSMGLLALVGLALGALRLALMGRFLALASHPVGSDLQALVDSFSARIGGPATHVHLCVCGRRLALASALAKVWQQALGPAEPLAGGAPALVGTTTGAGGVGMIEQRIERLMACAPVETPRSGGRSGPGSVGMGASALGGLLVLQAATATATLAPMVCDPNRPLVALLASVF